MKPRSYFAILLVFTLVICGSFFALGQGTDLGTIRGTVTDSSGAVVAQAAVTVTDSSTGLTRQTKTNRDGAYEIFGLRSGTYKAAVQASGFGAQEINGIVVNGSSVVGVNVTLRVASAQETVEVTVGAPPINTENPTIGDTIGSLAVIDLPRDSRDVYSFLYLNPNITQGAEPGNFKFTGFQSYGASFTLDGQRSTDGVDGSPTASEPSLEAVDEVNVLSDNFSAEYAGIANIRITTKRGTNQFHGSMFYNNKNSALAALTVQDQLGKASFAPSPLQPKYPNPAFNVNDIGASFGGPIPKLHNTWFFAAYERDYNVNPVYLQSTAFAHPSLYTGNFSLMQDLSKPDLPADLQAQMTSAELAADTTTVSSGGEQFQVLTQIPTRFLNPVVQNLINKYFPQVGLSAPIDPTTGVIGGVFQSSLPGRDTLDQGTLRLDHDFSDKDHVFLTFNASAETSALNPVSRNKYPGLGLNQTHRQNDTIGLSYTRVFRPNLVNEVRGGFNKQNLFSHSNTTLQGFLSGIGFDSSDIAAYAANVGNFALITDGQPQINFSSAFATFDNGGRNTFRPLSQALSTFGDTLTWVEGKHNLKFGADWVRNWALDGFALNKNNPRGSMTYTSPGTCATVGNNTGGDCLDNNPDPFVEFLLGNPPTTAQFNLKNRPAMDVHNWEQGFFVQDDWKVSSHFTLNLGLRYDLITPFIEKNDILVNFDPNLTDPLNGQKGVFVIPSDKTLPFLDSRIVDYGFVTAAQTHNGIGRGLIRTDKNNFAPRLGFAWALGDKSVIRGGYGFFYPTSAAQGIRDPIATNGFNQQITTRKTLEGWPGFVHGISPITGGTPKGFGNTPSGEAVPIDLQDPRVQQWNATFERQIGWNSTVRFSYLGSHAGGLIAGHDLNELPPSTAGFGTSSGANTPDGSGDGVTPCDPIIAVDCSLSAADNARYPYPIIGEFLVSFGNFARSNSNAFQTQFERHYKSGLMISLSYTYLDQKSTVGDSANASLGSEPYNPFQPDLDYTTDGFVSKHRFVAYGVYDLPLGRGRQFAGGMSKLTDAFIGGWQTTFNMFAKSGTGYTPFWFCDDCDPIFPGNIGVGSVDAVGDFGAPDFRPNIISHSIYTGHGGSGSTVWNVAAYGPPSVGADFLSNSTVAKRNMLVGPSMWGVNLGVHKNFQFNERISANIGADVDNIFNHPLLAPDFNDGGSGGGFANVGEFFLPPPVAGPPGQQPVLVPITAPNPACPFAGNSCIRLNPSFGQLIKGYDQEGVSSRREIRLRLRVTF